MINKLIQFLGETVAQHNLKDGLTVHLVIKTGSAGGAPNRPTTTTSNPSSNSTPTPNPLAGGLGLGSDSLGNLLSMSMGAGGNFADMQQRMQREMLSNPDMFRQMMDNPFVQQLMNNPEYLRSVLTTNPQMQQLMEASYTYLIKCSILVIIILKMFLNTVLSSVLIQSNCISIFFFFQRNPEISHMLNNPDVLRQISELTHNPAMLQELMRSHDRALSNLESIPGRRIICQSVWSI